MDLEQSSTEISSRYSPKLVIREKLWHGEIRELQNYVTSDNSADNNHVIIIIIQL